MADSAMDLQIDGKDVYSLRVVDLKQELKKRDIPFKGNATKAQLQSLLVEFLTANKEPSEPTADETPKEVIKEKESNDKADQARIILKISLKKSTEKETTDAKSAGEEPSEVKTSEAMAIETETTDTKTTETESTESETTESETSESDSSEAKTTEPDITQVVTTDGKSAEEETLGSVISEAVPTESKTSNVETTHAVPTEVETIQAVPTEISRDEEIAALKTIESVTTEPIEKEITEVKPTEEITAPKTIEPEVVEHKATEEVITELKTVTEAINLVTEEKATEKEIIEAKTVDEVITETKTAEEVIEEPKAIEKELPEAKSTEEEIPVVKTTKKEITESKSTEEAIEMKATNEKTTEKDKTERVRPRRRRWGGSVSSDVVANTPKGISSDQLKDLIPDMDSTDNSSTASKVSKSETIVVTSSLSRTQSNQSTENKSQVPLKQDIRVVRKSVSVQEEEQTPVKPSTPVAKQKTKIVVEPDAEPKEIAERAVSPPRKPESNVIFIQNLVRPFTLLQLKEILGKTGKLIEERFWIDKIKSKCFATYETKEEAVATRLALHGTRWPTSNPKILSVDFATKEKLDSHLNPDLNANQDLNHRKSEDNQKFDIVIKNDTTEQKTARDKENKPDGRPIREWDREKLSVKEEDRRAANRKRGESPSKSQERDGKRRRTGEERVRPADSTSGEQPVVETAKESESPAKLLDDLFKKTNATPSIYWLPLTEEQASARSVLREEEEKKRAEERMAREEQFRKRQEENPRRRPSEPSPPFRNERNKWRTDSPPRRNFGRRGSPPFRRSPPGRRSPPRRRSPNRYSRSRSPIPRRKR